MTRLACAFGLVAVALAVVLATHPSGPAAIGFCFVGVPALTAGAAVYGAQRWRATHASPAPP